MHEWRNAKPLSVAKEAVSAGARWGQNFVKFGFVKMEVLVKSGTRAESIAMIVFLCALIVQIECMTR